MVIKCFAGKIKIDLSSLIIRRDTASIFEIEEITFAEKTVAACSPVPVYARVDVIWDNDNHLCVSELELIEPELWFRTCPGAAELFAEEVVKFLKKG